jgi:hypothetical protein
MARRFKTTWEALSKEHPLAPIQWDIQKGPEWAAGFVGSDCHLYSYRVIDQYYPTIVIELPEPQNFGITHREYAVWRKVFNGWTIGRGDNLRHHQMFTSDSFNPYQSYYQSYLTR